ncbi:MAG: phospho-sugar mutase [Bacteroidales bacterium]|jgi:phosphoglucomutase|nr:phospho-sugar mutase [Bacteroidales bacterium]
MEETTRKNIDAWLNGQYDEESKNYIHNLLQTDESALEDAFYRDLEFGTGGLRGIMGVGTNRMNKYTVAMATQGLANYVKQHVTDKTPSMAIAYDCRNNSRYFSEITAEVLSSNGIEVYLFDDIRPTPELSFAVRYLHCDSGIVITASHNPKEYNGYKAYWADGGQLVPPHDKNVIAEVRKIKSIADVKFTRNDKLIHYIGKEIDAAYIAKLKTLSLHPDAIEEYSHLKIVYSPLHGTGVKIVPEALAAFGFKNVHVVKEQAVSDGNFPTVISPNPEEAEALSLSLKEAEAINADIVMATDPDSDRVGIAIKDKDGKFILLNGNMTASLIVYYICKMWQQNNKINGKQYIVKTIVTTELLAEIAHKYHVKSYDVLTGFKYIAEKIRELEDKEEFICGGEESYGYLVGDFVRDKDAVISCCMITEIVAWAKKQQKSLYDVLVNIYLEFGYYKERLFSLTRKGQNGAMEIKQMMNNYRNNPPEQINGVKVVEIRDYKSSEIKNLLNNTTEKITLPSSDVLQFILKDESKITVRPSGTEPKIKFYFSVKSPFNNPDDAALTEKLLDKKIDDIIQCLVTNG